MIQHIIYALIGFITNKKSYIMNYMAIELMTVSQIIELIYGGQKNQEIDLAYFGFVLLLLAGVGSSIGIVLLINYYRIRKRKKEVDYDV